MRQRTHRIGDTDLHLFNEGTHRRLYQVLGTHAEGDGTSFAVWAPNAVRVAVTGDFNGWDPSVHALDPLESSGIWTGTVPGAAPGAGYKFHITSRLGHVLEKADPFAFHAETPPRTASVIWDLSYDWGDREWMRTRAERQTLRAPISIYEVHPGSWMRMPEEGNRWLTYRELGDRLAEYALRNGFTHVELLPLMEHPFYGSWGYQTTGYFAPTSRYGTPQDLMAMIDTLHQSGVGVILDWVPSHFPNDAHGLAFFDGTHLYEHADPRLGFHPDWRSAIFNYGRNEVRAFLTSSAMFWLDAYHADGLRVDAVASMLYLDYSREAGEWIPNIHGGRENLDAISFLRWLNEAIDDAHPDVLTYAEESTSWPGVSRPTHVGGLGFGLKWDMGWMHDTLQYASREPVHRRFHQNELTFRALYAYTENFVMPLSHDEVVHGKGSLVAKMPGDDWQRFANLRLLFGYQFTQPGKKLVFMGGEIAQREEWSHERSVDWHLLEHVPHTGMQRWIRDLNAAYRAEPALHQGDCDPSGFEWVDASDTENSVLCYLRLAADAPPLLVACNFTPVPRHGYRIGVPRAGRWDEILNSDGAGYGGSGIGNPSGADADASEMHGRPASVEITLPPLAIVVLRATA